MKVLRLCATVVCALSLAVGVAGAQIATFDGATLGDTTPYTEGIASFSSLPDTAGFNISQTQAFDPSASPTDQLLAEAGVGNTLTIAFSLPVINPSFDLFLTDSNPADLTFNGGGIIGVSGGAIDPLDPFTNYRVNITILDTVNMITLAGAQGQSIGVDNFRGRITRPGQVPEPGTLAFLAGGLVPLALAIRRRRA